MSVFRQDETPMRLKVVDGDQLIGVDPADEATTLAMGQALVNTRIRVWMAGELYAIKIKAVTHTETFWVGANLPIERYAFEYRPLADGPGDDYTPLCSKGADPTMLEAFVFEGDLYDPDTKRITVGALTKGWMNIACADSAIYKMHKIGHTTAAQKTGVVTTLPQRHAMLNAWTSNVCGTGEAFTVQGEPITLRESLGVFNQAPYNAVPPTYEAIWDEDGAVCLNTHRLHEDDDKIYDKIAAACPGGVVPPRCDGQFGWLALWRLRGHVLTGNLP
jgi:hypothetical protein